MDNKMAVLYVFTIPVIVKHINQLTCIKSTVTLFTQIFDKQQYIIHIGLASAMPFWHI